MNPTVRNHKPFQSNSSVSGNKSSTQNSSSRSNHVNIRVEVLVPNRGNYHKENQNSSPNPQIQPLNGNTRPYNIQNYNSQNYQSKFSNIDKENRPPPREKKSPPSRRSQDSNLLSEKFRKQSPPYVVKQNAPSKQEISSPPRQRLETQYKQSNSTYLPPLSQNSKRTTSFDQSDRDQKSIVYSPKKLKTTSQRASVLKEIDSNIIQPPASRRGWTRNGDRVGELLNDPTPTDQNYHFGSSQNHQVPRRGKSSENRSNWDRDNLARKEKIVGIRNFSNTCFAGSLLQCLYHLPTFKECLYKCVKDHPSELISGFEELFRLMDRADVGDVNSSALKLILKLFQIRSHEFKLGTQGSSEMLFRAITEEFGPSSPLVQLFWKGRYSKIAKCQECSNQMKMTEDVFILHSKDIDYKLERADDGNLFQPQSESRRCRGCHIRAPHNIEYEFDSLPNVLVIAISDTGETKSSNKLIPNISVRTKDEQTVKYEYFAGIVNIGKGSRGLHSIAIVKSNENEDGAYFELNDSIATRLQSLDSVSLYPKLLFYQKINFSSPHKPNTPPYAAKNENHHQQEIVKEHLKETLEVVSRGRQMESRNENTQRQIRCVSHDPRLAQNVNPARQHIGKRTPLENKQGTSYAGALLQCLYHLPNFKTLLHDYKIQCQGYVREIVSSLVYFFASMDQTSAEFVNKSALEFVQFVTETFKSKYQINKDSRKLWEAIFQELGSGRSIAFTSFLSLFAATSEVRTICRSCNQAQTSSPQSFTSCVLDEKYYTFEWLGRGVLSTSSKSFKCKCLFTAFVSQDAELVFSAFPDILVVNVISLVTFTDKPASKILPKIMLKGSDKTLQTYEYHAGVLTLVRRGDGQHSIAVIQCGGSKDSYSVFDDGNVRKTNLDDIVYHPRLLFYRKSTQN